MVDFLTYRLLIIYMLKEALTFYRKGVPIHILQTCVPANPGIK